MPHISERLVLRRNALNMTQDALAEASGVSKRAIGKYEKGQGLPTARILEKLAAALKWTPADFFADPYARQPAAAPAHGALAEAPDPRRALEMLRISAAALAEQATALVRQIAYFESQFGGLSSDTDAAGSRQAVEIAGDIAARKPAGGPLTYPIHPSGPGKPASSRPSPRGPSSEPRRSPGRGQS